MNEPATISPLDHLLAVAAEAAKQLRAMGETAHSSMLDRAREAVEAIQ